MACSEGAEPSPGKRIRWATQEEARALIATLPDHLAAMAEFSLATGLRQYNVTHLEWSQVDLGRRVAWIYADQAKGKRDFAVPLSDAAAAVLQRQLGAHPIWVFPYRGGPIKQPTQVAWQTAVEAVGLSGFRWHDLRHTWASWHVQNGTPFGAAGTRWLARPEDGLALCASVARAFSTLCEQQRPRFFSTTN